MNESAARIKLVRRAPGFSIVNFTRDFNEKSNPAQICQWMVQMPGTADVHQLSLDNSRSTDNFKAMKNNLWLRSSTLLATVLLAFGLVTRGHAQVTGNLALLDDAYATLAQGDHDYGGHRIRAMKQIEAAVNDLDGKIGGNGHGHEPQGTSDAQMKAAEALLQQAVPGLPAKALKRVNKAIIEINDGLAIH
jgi:hypothetical protein